MGLYLSALIEGLCFAGIVFGIYISMKIFNIPDITTDGSYTLGGMITGTMLTQNQPGWLIFITVIITGGMAGALTGIIHTKLKINALLAGILVMTALYSVNITVSGRSNLPVLGRPTIFSAINILTDPNQNALLVLSLLISGLTLLLGYLLKTDFGIAMRATGSSEQMIRALGVNTDRMKIIGLAIANSLTALSGYLITQSQGFADISMGIGMVIIGLGSVIIAETIINWFKITSVWLSLMSVLAGVIIFRFVLAFTLDIGVNPNMLKAVTAVFVLIIVGLPRLFSSKA